MVQPCERPRTSFFTLSLTALQRSCLFIRVHQRHRRDGDEHVSCQPRMLLHCAFHLSPCPTTRYSHEALKYLRRVCTFLPSLLLTQLNMLHIFFTILLACILPNTNRGTLGSQSQNTGVGRTISLYSKPKLLLLQYRY